MPEVGPIASATRRAYVDTACGTVHVATAAPDDGEGGTGTVLLLHQSPRSSDEYRDVLPLVAAAGWRAVAMDTLGYGASDPVPGGVDSIEAYAEGGFALLDALGIERAAVVGHHTGGVIAVEMAAAQPDRVAALVLSSTPLVDAASRERRRRSRPIIDDIEVAEDGSHLAELWRQRAPVYPPGRPDLLNRLVADALRAGDRIHLGHAAVARYEMEARLPLVRARTLVIGASADPYGFPHTEHVAAAIPGATTAVIEGGMVPLPDQLPEEFARVVLGFLATA